MKRRTFHWTVSFQAAFRLGGNLFPPGTYEIWAEVDASHQPKEVCWREIQFYITIEHWNRRERRPIDLRALDGALRRDRAAVANANVVPSDL